MTKLFSPSSARLFGAALLAVSLSSFPETAEAFSAAATTTSTSSSTTAADVAVPPVQVADPNNPLIQLANEFTYTKSGFYSPYDEDAFSDDFVFRGPYIGPLNKKDYLSVMNTFSIHKAIPDINPNAFGWSIDPKDPNRVWFMVRNTGTFNGEPLGLGNGIDFPSNGSQLKGCPETFSLTFDEDQKAKYLSVGYVADRFEGNTNGAGAAVGIFNCIGLPFPKPGPLLKFAQWFGTEVVNGGAVSYSTENVPTWWTNEDKASEGYL